MKLSEQTSDTKYGMNLGQKKKKLSFSFFFQKERVRWREKDGSGEVKKDKKKISYFLCRVQ